MNVLVFAWRRALIQLKLASSCTSLTSKFPLERRVVAILFCFGHAVVFPSSDSVVLGKHSSMTEPPFETVRLTISVSELVG